MKINNNKDHEYKEEEKFFDIPETIKQYDNLQNNNKYE